MVTYRPFYSILIPSCCSLYAERGLSVTAQGWEKNMGGQPNPYYQQQYPQQPALQAPSPGWYDSDGAKRWWDGARWGPVAPLADDTSPPAAPAATAAPARAPFPWAWAVALSPLVLLAVAVVGALLGGPSGNAGTYILIGEAVTIAVAFIAIDRDRRTLARAGEPQRRLWFWFPLIPWIYLWMRAVRRPGRTNAD